MGPEFDQFKHPLLLEDSAQTRDHHQNGLRLRSSTYGSSKKINLIGSSTKDDKGPVFGKCLKIVWNLLIKIYILLSFVL